ncbi:MAG TPA: hypothetical protein VFH78_13060, partial [Candidatus Thermoplasmatota archaeon]|nr:hypothetical protein [Candidatus Thermoplasmatota archaeon]
VWTADGGRAWANWTYEGTDWRGRCEGDAGARTYRAGDPPHWPLFNAREGLQVGQPVEAWYLDGCRIRSLEAVYEGARDGRHFASAEGFRTSWDDRTGLVLAWEHGVSFGRLSGTDAPLR